MATCRACRAQAVPDAPVALCPSCMVTAYRYVRDRMAEERKPGAQVSAGPDGLLEGVRRTRDDRGSVYYLRMGDRIKIGTSIDPSARIRSMSIPADSLMATEPGGRRVEQARHRQFAHLRVDLEWFRADPELLAHIGALRLPD